MRRIGNSHKVAPLVPAGTLWRNPPRLPRKRRPSLRQGKPPRSTPDLAIRLRLAAFNRALAEADLDAIAPILGPDVLLVTGTDSAILSGRTAQLLGLLPAGIGLAVVLPWLGYAIWHLYTKLVVR